jgi:hypothetical protein
MSEPPTNILRAARFADIEHRLLELGIMPSHLVEYVRLAEYTKLAGDDSNASVLIADRRMRVAQAVLNGEIDECLPMMIRFLDINLLYPDDSKA